MPETNSIYQLPLCCICRTNFLCHPAPDLDPGRLIDAFNLAINEMDSLGQSPATTCARECDSCPVLSLLALADEIISQLCLLLDNLPSADCPVADSFNLSNIRPSLDSQK